MTRSLQLLMPGNPITLRGTITVSSTSSGWPRVDFNSDGTITYRSNGVSGLYYPQGWYQAVNDSSPGPGVAGIGSQYEIRLTPITGAFGLELENTWVSLSAGTSWDSVGSSTGTIEIRNAATDVVLGSCALSLVDG